MDGERRHSHREAADKIDAVIVVRILDVHRLTSLFCSEVSASSIQIVVIEMPDYGWPCVVQHPLDNTRGSVLITRIRFKHGPFAVIGHGLRDARILLRGVRP